LAEIRPHSTNLTFDLGERIRGKNMANLKYTSLKVTSRLSVAAIVLCSVTAMAQNATDICRPAPVVPRASGSEPRRTSAWEDSAVWGAPHRHRKVGTWELPKPWPFSLAFRWPGRYGLFQRGRYSNEAIPSSSRCLLERSVYPPAWSAIWK